MPLEPTRSIRARPSTGPVARIKGQPSGQSPRAESDAWRHTRPMQLDWVHHICDQCIAAGVPFLFKQGAVHGRKLPLPEARRPAMAAIPDRSDMSRGTRVRRGPVLTAGSTVNQRSGPSRGSTFSRPGAPVFQPKSNLRLANPPVACSRAKGDMRASRPATYRQL
jgi:Protein of unknown function (DUF5131)